MKKLTVPDALDVARRHLQAGRLEQAHTICRVLLQSAADDPQVHRLAAAIAQGYRDFGLAAEELLEAARRAETDADLWEEAGAMLEAVRNWPEAEQAAREALARDPQRPEAKNLLGDVLQAQGRLEEAEAEYRGALELDPNADRTWSNLGALLQRLGRLEEAEQAYLRSLAIRPLQSEAHANLGALMRLTGRMEEAETAYRRAIEIQPIPAAYFNLGVLLQAAKRLDEAEQAYRRTLEMAPGHVKALYNLAMVLHRPGRWAESERAYRRVLELDPRYAPAAVNLGNLLYQSGRIDEAAEALRKALEIAPDRADAHSALLVCLQCRPGLTPEELLEAHRDWDSRHAAPRAPAVVPLRRIGSDRRLRLGFVSADLGRHPVGLFLVSALEALDRSQCEVLCYSDRSEEDEITRRIRAASSIWRPTAAIGDEALAEQIRADAVDVLFDLAGHTARNRLLVFARRPAPTQITWLGYPGTTGMQAMDYLLADWHQVPEGFEGHHREKVLRMPDGYACYAPPPDAPEVGPLRAASAGRVTFGSFSNPSKIQAGTIELWAEILRRLPRSRLVLKYSGLDDPDARARYEGMFAERQVPAEQLDLSGEVTPAELLGWYNRVDIALDTRPYSGGLTTCEALWMGVPVVTWPGDTFAGRHALSHISAAGLEGTVAFSASEYVEIACRLAGDLERLAAIRSSLRARVAASPLCDAPRFAEGLLRILRQELAATSPAGKVRRSAED